MRAVVAKALRRQARAETGGMPERAYLSRRHEKVREIPKRDKRGSVMRDAIGQTVMERIKVTSEEVKLDPNSTKGRYRQLKQWRRS